MHSLLYGPQFSSDCSSDGPKRSFSVRKTRKGPTIVTISPTCVAYEEGLRPGCLITHVKDIPYTNDLDFNKFYEDALNNQDKITYVISTKSQRSNNTVETNTNDYIEDNDGLPRKVHRSEAYYEKHRIANRVLYSTTVIASK